LIQLSDFDRSLAIAPIIRDIADILMSKNHIAVLSHNSADGDTLGSSVAVCVALHKLNKDVSLIYEEELPGYLSFLKAGHNFFRLYDDAVDESNRSWDAIMVFDTADPKLLGKRMQMLGHCDCVINIDHHVSNHCFGDYNLIDTKASATAELAYHLNVALGVPLDNDTALAIYTGICTDTGGFSYSNTTYNSHEIAARTLRFGIDVAFLRYKFFDATSHSKLRCQTYVANALRFYDNGRYAISIVPATALVELGATEADCEGLVNIGRNVDGVRVSILAREVRQDEFRINLRSRGDFDVSAVARKFGGGGHKLAAGCTISAKPSEIESILLDALYGMKI